MIILFQILAMGYEHPQTSMIRSTVKKHEEWMEKEGLERSAALDASDVIGATKELKTTDESDEVEDEEDFHEKRTKVTYKHGLPTNRYIAEY